MATNAQQYERTQRKREFAELVTHYGFTPAQAIKKLGIKDKHAVGKYLDDPEVKQFLAEYEEQNRKEMKVTRDTVQGIIMEAIEMGRLMSDPLALIRGAQELNKMCGFYAPEKKELHLSASQRRRIEQFDGMPDEELVKVVEEGTVKDIIEAEFSEIPNEEDWEPTALPQGESDGSDIE